jgi:Protein of unknown function (DUF3606)
VSSSRHPGNLWAILRFQTSRIEVRLGDHIAGAKAVPSPAWRKARLFPISRGGGSAVASSCGDTKTAMSDDPKKRGSQDRSRINIHEDYEVQYWSKKFGVSPDQLKAAVKKVGNSVAAVQQELSH